MMFFYALTTSGIDIVGTKEEHHIQQKH